MFFRSIEIGTRSPITKSPKDFLSFWTKLSTKFTNRVANNKVNIFIPMKFRKWDEKMIPIVSQTSSNFITNRNRGRKSLNEMESISIAKALIKRHSKFRMKESRHDVFDQESSDDIDTLNWQITMINEINSTINIIESTMHQVSKQNNNNKILQASIVPCISLRMFDNLNQMSNCLDGFKRASNVFTSNNINSSNNNSNTSIDSVLLVGGPSIDDNIFREDEYEGEREEREEGEGEDENRINSNSFRENALEIALTSGIFQDYGINTIWFGGYPEGNLHQKQNYDESMLKLKNKIDIVNKHCKNYINNVSLITQLCLDEEAIVKFCDNDIIQSNCNEIRIGTPYCKHSKLLYYGKICGVGKNTIDKMKQFGKKQDSKRQMFDIENEFTQPLIAQFEKQGKSNLLLEKVTGIHVFDLKANSELVL